MPTTIPDVSPAIAAGASPANVTLMREKVLAVICDPDFIVVTFIAAVGLLVAAFLTAYLPFASDAASLLS